jgi:hypothetical protein
MKFSDLKAKAEQLGVDKAVKQAAEKAAQLAAENKGTVSTWVDKAGRTVDEKTGGKYTDKVEKAKTGVTGGVDKLAARHPGTGQPAAPAPQADAAPSGPTTAAPEPTVPPAPAYPPASPPVDPNGPGTAAR